LLPAGFKLQKLLACIYSLAHENSRSVFTHFCHVIFRFSMFVRLNFDDFLFFFFFFFFFNASLLDGEAGRGGALRRAAGRPLLHAQPENQEVRR
jgi:hypothetical protein